MRTRSVVLLLVVALIAAACSADDTPALGDVASDATIPDPDFRLGPLPTGESRDYGSPPPFPDDPISPELREALDRFFGWSLGDGIFLQEDWDALAEIVDTGDVRYAWLLSDVLRLATGPDLRGRLTGASESLMQTDINDLNPWGDVVDHLIAWDVPAPPEYVDYKRGIYTLVERGWNDLFVESDKIDWRYVSWGGVRIDDRPYDTTDDNCNCIPAADNPEVESAAEATWLDDDSVVFGVVINGEARAYPRRIMEVREMVNDTLGGRDIAMPYCTLCGSAQVYLTDEVPDGVARPILRTSGLLSRSNKVMYDVETKSIFDTFTGEAVTGTLADREIVLPQVSVVTALWADWVAEHPDTTVLIEDLALGRDFDFRNNRDANGPIFPIGDVDPRLAVQEDVVGVFTESGTPVAFHVASAVSSLQAGYPVEFENVRLVLDGGGVRAVDLDGNPIASHQAFWFAWSQFHPDTALWPS